MSKLTTRIVCKNTIKATPVSKLPLHVLRDRAMKAASNVAFTGEYTAIVKAIAARTRQPAKKIRRQARTKFWAESRA